uniref:kelch-like protein 20 n=1 Tax=Styela clava TaxID=7725 RepID=UPI00193A40F5|nr:kelch-like protein 20 [Styela clava]
MSRRVAITVKVLLGSGLVFTITKMELTTDGYDKDHCAEIMKKLNEMRKSKEHCDIAIKVGNEEILAHRNILSAGSDYFRAMLFHENVESRSGVVQMKQTEFSSVRICIDFIYTGHLSIPDYKNCKQLMHTAHIMQLQKVCENVATYLRKKINIESFYSAKIIADMFNCTKLLECCEKFALKNFQHLAMKDDFKHLEKEFVSLLIGSRNTKASEDIKCKALIIWTNFERGTRTSTFEALFEKLNLTKIASKYQSYLIQKEPSVFNSDLCTSALTQANDLTNVEPEDVDIATSKFVTNENVIAVFSKTTCSIHVFNPFLKTWTEMQKIDKEFVAKYFTAAVLNDIIYVFGNYGNNYKLDYTDINATWVRLDDRKSAKKRAIGVAFGNYIYAFADHGWYSNAVEKYDPYDETWSDVTHKPVEGFGSSIVSLGSFIYCIGGVNNTGHMSNNLRFNPSDLTWEELPSMPTARKFSSAAGLEEKIYAMGGTQSFHLNIVECFDTVAETWTTVASLNNARAKFTSCVVGDKLFVVGGELSNNTIEELDPESNTWNVVDKMSGKFIQANASVPLYILP